MGTQDERLEQACTGIAASWCPNCGNCTCDRYLEVQPGIGQGWGDIRFEDPKCPLHGDGSLHTEFPSCYACGGEFRTVVARDEHEVGCG